MLLMVIEGVYSLYWNTYTGALSMSSSRSFVTVPPFAPTILVASFSARKSKNMSPNFINGLVVASYGRRRTFSPTKETSRDFAPLLFLVKKEIESFFSFCLTRRDLSTGRRFSFSCSTLCDVPTTGEFFKSIMTRINWVMTPPSIMYRVRAWCRVLVLVRFFILIVHLSIFCFQRFPFFMFVSSPRIKRGNFHFGKIDVERFPGEPKRGARLEFSSPSIQTVNAVLYI